jgi:hypothetical protein
LTAFDLQVERMTGSARSSRVFEPGQLGADGPFRAKSAAGAYWP